MRQEHIVPLSRQAVEVLRELHPLTGGGRYVFPSARTSGRAMERKRQRGGATADGLRTRPDDRAWFFRTMASTLLNEMGWPADAIERQLAHTERDGVRDAYNRAEYLAERRRIMQSWADYLRRLTAEGVVIPLGATARPCD